MNNHEKHDLIKNFSGTKTENIKHYVKSTQEKQSAQTIIYVGTKVQTR